MTRAGVVCAGVAFFSLAALGVAAVTVKTGTLQAVAAADRTLSVKFAHSDKPIDVRMADEVEVRLDGKMSRLEALKPGMSVTLEIGSEGRAELIRARTATDRPATSPLPKSTRPKLSTAHKSTKTKTSKHKTEQAEKSPRLFGDSAASTPLAKTDAPAFKGSFRASANWPCFLGPNRDNVSQETGLLRSWPEGGPPLAWSTPGLGQGYSTVSISGGIVFSMGTPENQESVLAVDLESGKPLWSVPTGGDVFRETSGNGPRSTPTIDGGHAYALGANGDLVSIDIKTKAVAWHKNIAQEFGSARLTWGFAESVLIDGEKLICTPGAPGATMVALDKNTGNLIWKSSVPGNPAAGYSSAIAVEAAGVRQYVNFLSTGVAGIRANDGQFLWGNTAAANTSANCAAPVFFRDRIFVSSGYNGGAALVQLSPGESGAVQATLAYHTREMNNHHGGFVSLGGYVYGSDNEILKCFSLEQGKAAWASRSVGKCSLTCADGHLYVRSETGPVALVEATPDGYRETGRFSPPTSDRHSWAYPVVAAGRLFLRDQDGLLCYSLRENK